MKSRSATLIAAQAGPMQRPGVLVEINFGTTRRWSSAGTVAWNGHTWTAKHLRVDNLLVQPLRVSGALVIGNEDDEIGTLVLSEGVQDRRIVLWGFDAAALADVADAVWLGEAVGGAVQVGAHEVRITLRHRTEFVESPRTYVNAAAGFNHMLPAGTVLRINGIDMRLERRGG
jgi:hypothetical protein